MSLILEALRKLEREKQLPDRGLVVVATANWPERSRTVPLWLAGIGLAAAAGSVGWLIASRSPSSAVAPPAAPPLSVAAAVPAAMPPRAMILTAPVPVRRQTQAGTGAASPETRGGSGGPVSPRTHDVARPSTSATGSTTAAPPPSVPAGPTVPGIEFRALDDAPPSVDTAPPPATQAPPPAKASAPLVTVTGTDAQPQLSAISELNGQRVAIVNGRLVHEGDSFNGVKVIRIGVGEVEVEVAGHRQVLTF